MLINWGWSGLTHFILMSIINNFSGRKYWLDGVVDFSAEIRQLFSPADVSSRIYFLTLWSQHFLRCVCKINTWVLGQFSNWKRIIFNSIICNQKSLYIYIIIYIKEIWALPLLEPGLVNSLWSISLLRIKQALTCPQRLY